MKNYKIKTTLLALLVSQTITVANADFVQKSSGSPVPTPSEFRQNTLGYGSATNPQAWRAAYGETRVNRMFIETFHLKIPRRCRVKSATFKIRLRNLGELNHNDSFYMTQGGNHLYGQYIWSNEPLGAPKHLTFNLGNLPSHNQVLTGANANLINSLTSDKKFSFLVQDDTSVTYARLDYNLTGGKHCYRKGRHDFGTVIFNRDRLDVIKQKDIPKFIQKFSSNHSHNGRSHRHVLPAQGKAHRHGNGATGR